MKKSSKVLSSLGVILTLFLGISQPIYSALKPEYLRNGECYLLIGEGSAALRGVYRLNNPEKEKFYKDNIVISGGSINGTMGFNVDLNRNIYTFTENTNASWQADTDPLYRQVIDTVPANHADYGYHTWIHYDHRQWNKGNIYRTGPVGRGIRSNGGGTWGAFRSAGPGTPASKPSGYTLPSMSGAAACGEYSGRTWYKIPNYSWYSSWRTGGATDNGYTYFYYVYGDRVDVKKHNYYLWTWDPDNPSADTPNYSLNKGELIAETKEEQIRRDCLAGCLDGCGGASGSGSAPADKILSDVAFQPPYGSGTARTYFYKRTDGTGNHDITINNTSYRVYNKGSNQYIGAPSNKDTYWLCISLKDDDSDYVYSLGTTVIRDWLKQASGLDYSNMDIKAVTVSNQWSQEGGICYAYDKRNKKIYKFVRKESSGTPITDEDYLGLSVGDILKEIDANSNSEIDDIKADGFGSLYFALSHPSKSVSTYNPPDHFKPNDCIHIHHIDRDNGKDRFSMIYCQEYGKKVFQRDIDNGKITQIGSKNYATRYYNVTVKIETAGWNDVYKLITTKGLPNDDLCKMLASWSAEVAGIKQTKETNWPASYYLQGLGEVCRDYTELNYTDPGNCKLSVINIPTPPKVLSLSGYKSFLDIVGPYRDYPFPGSNSTNQGEGLMPSNTPLELNQVYYYMVENYPLPSGAQDPTDPDTSPDWDKDGRHGGFISSIRIPKYYNPYDEIASGGVKYEWKTWMVMDLYGNCCCREIQRTERDENGNLIDCKPYNYVYSPVFGKFIMTCKVIYNWYNYDDLAFGATIKDLSSVFHKNEVAIPPVPSASGDEFTHQTASSRLEEIKKSFYFSGKVTGNKNVAFMNAPFDQDGNPITNLDFSQIIKDDNGNIDEYLALQPITVGNGLDAPPPTPSEIAAITRCDDIPGVATSTYINKDSFWSPVPSEDKTFGIVAGEKYNWRIDIASQTNMFKDISKCNGEDEKQPNYNYIAHQLIATGSEYWVNSKPNFIFRNVIGDIRWADDKILVSASLVYKVPDGGSEKEISLPLKHGKVTSSSDVGTDFEDTYFVKNESSLWQKNTPVYFTTSGDLPPTDPMDAKIQIRMRRQYSYDMWAYSEGMPLFPIKNLPGWLQITGEAKIRIMDTVKPDISYAETVPNNLFGITGRALTEGEGPKAGFKNPKEILFTIKDNNPWEATDKVGLSLAEHIKNVALNFGSKYCKEYCGSNTVMINAMSGLGNINGYKEDIKTKKEAKQKTSDINYKPLFSKEARDVRLMFETSRRNNSGNDIGAVKVDRADRLYVNNSDKRQSVVAGRSFYQDNSDLAFHYRSGKSSDAKMKVTNRSSSEVIGNTTVYTSKIQYSLPLTSLKFGTEKVDNTNTYKATNVVPDGYANNTPGYATYDSNGKITAIRPYKFYINACDSSGNFLQEQELNLVLNVRDDIPPVGFGSVLEYKNETFSYFPYQTETNATASSSTDINKAPIYSLTGENYFDSDNLDSKTSFVRNDKWEAYNDSDGYINNYKGKYAYKALKYLSGKEDKIVTGYTDSVYKEQIKKHLAPIPIEDNVECEFATYVSDNAGLATATLTIKYFATANGDDNDQKTASVDSSWKSASDISSFKGEKDADKHIASSSANVIHAVFRGRKEQFPMAIPIIIESYDNARDWDYYSKSNVQNSGWTWGPIIEGKSGDDSNSSKSYSNKRTFKTSMPVYGSDLDIRILDKTLTNE